MGYLLNNFCGVGRFGGGGIMMFGGAIIIGLAVYLVTAHTRHQTVRYAGEGNHGAALNNALSILNERYAKGEISDQEYTAKKAELRR